MHFIKEISTKFYLKFYFNISLLLISFQCFSQHNANLFVNINSETKVLQIKHELEYNNNSQDTIKELYFADWNNAYSDKNSALGKKFSDEFVRSFHLAKESERGFTKIISIVDDKFSALAYIRTKSDIVKIDLKSAILPNSKASFTMYYEVKIPDDKFTRYGYNNQGKFNLKYWYLQPFVYDNGKFITFSNENLDDLSSALSNYNLQITVPENYNLFSNLIEENQNKNSSTKIYNFKGNFINDVLLVAQPNNYSSAFTTYKNEIVELSSSLKEYKINDFQKAVIVDKITRFLNNKTGNTNVKKVLITEEDYDKQPFYGLNQLPSFISPFHNEFLFELKLLKTYTYNYLKSSLQINQRKNAWMLDGIQVYFMMQYINENYPNLKLTGNLANLKILKSYHFINLDFNEQYNYAYMLMARKNLDQPLNEQKNKLIKFNEQIANKYRAGISLAYLDHYLGKNILGKSIQDYILLNKNYFTNSNDFEQILKCNTTENIDWFFRTLIETRELIDYKFGKIKKEKENIKVEIKNITNTNVPISLYEIKNDTVINKIWLKNVKKDTLITLPYKAQTKLALNYQNEIPEYNLRNNFKSIQRKIFNKPLKVNFYKDLENPKYNQIFYIPEFEYNLYDGIGLGLKFNNRSMLNKPFIFNISPMYSTNTGKVVGGISAIVEKQIRDVGKLYNIRYAAVIGQGHYTYDAKYTNFIPSVTLRFRDKDLRNNKGEYIILRQVYINRENSKFVNVEKTENYNVFNAKYGNYQSEGTKLFSFSTDLQLASLFGKTSAEINYRKLFEDNRQINLRFYAGYFLYKDTSSNFYDFGISKPNDYLFDYNLLGRSETTGLFSQQYVYGQAGFKSFFSTQTANQWVTSLNAGFNIWNWVQIYSDFGLAKSINAKPKFLYDSGIHLNLVPDYFELFLPVHSSNGWEFSNNYGEKIRFVVTLQPKLLVSLFTRKWF